MFSKNPAVLIVDDEPSICDLLLEELGECDCKCSAVPDGKAAIIKMATQDFDIVLLDIRLPDISGMEVLNTIKTDYPNTAVIMITGVNNVETAVEAMKLGASDYIVKPFDLNRIYQSIGNTSKAKQHSTEARDYETLPHLERDEKKGASTRESIRYMNAIARGVEIGLDQLLGYSGRVNERTIDIAYQLGIPVREIQKWSAVRSKNIIKRNAAIKSLLKRFQQSPHAQRIMETMLPYRYIPKLNKSQN